MRSSSSTSSPTPSHLPQHGLAQYPFLAGVATLMYREVAPVVSFVLRIELDQLKLNRFLLSTCFDHPRVTTTRFLSEHFPDTHSFPTQLGTIRRMHTKRSLTTSLLWIVYEDPRHFLLELRLLDRRQ